MSSILDKIFKERLGRILISIIWGLGLATLFRRVCKGRNCIVIKSPDPEDIEGKIFQFENKCYSFEPVSARCSRKKIQ